MSTALWQFIRTSVAFVAFLAIAAVLLDRRIGHHFASHRGAGLIGDDVYVPLQRASQHSPNIHTIFLGDSVARQLFHPGRELRPGVRYLTSNQAISMAGQFYMLEEAVRHYPRLREVYLFYFPKSFTNDLGPPFTNDYFCGYFHSPPQVAELFQLKRDFHLTAVQTGRMLLPNIMAINSAWRPTMNVSVAPAIGGGTASPGGGAEPLLDLLNRLSRARSPLPIQPDPEGEQQVVVSRTSRYFLAEMRALCRGRGIVLHVLPCPCSNQRHFLGVQRVYDAPVIYVDRTHFIDTIHLLDPFVQGVRQNLIETYYVESSPPLP